MKAADARVLLTGATGGIGQEAAAALVAGGACVLLAGRDAETLRPLAGRLRSQYGRSEGEVAWALADLGVPQDVQRLADAAARWRCNAVVHAAGTPAFGALEQIDAAAMQAVLQTNLLAPMLLTRALLPHLKRQPRAQVLCVGSVLGALGLPGFSVYSASKFGLRGFAEALRRELAGTPVRVQYLGPRTTRTRFNSAQAQAYNEATGTATDSPRSVALALVQLLEDEAAERFLGFPEKLGVRLNALVPAAMDGSFRRHARSLPPPAESEERTAS